jgi:hypothetical protein
MALNAAASFIEGCAFKSSFLQQPNTFAHLFEGKVHSVAVVWNSNSAYNLSLSVTSALMTGLSAFDTMGNPISTAVVDGSFSVESAAERPIFVQANSADALEAALSSMVVTPLLSVTASDFAKVIGTSNVTITLTARDDAVRPPLDCERHQRA